LRAIGPPLPRLYDTTRRQTVAADLKRKRTAMSKQWKITAANAGLRLYTRIAGNFRPVASFDPQQSF